jgi:hypothetical protein
MRSRAFEYGFKKTQAAKIRRENLLRIGPPRVSALSLSAAESCLWLTKPGS